MWEKIKKILSKGDGKCILVEDNQPTYVIIKWEDYENMIDNYSVKTEEVNRNIDNWKAENDAKDKSEDKIAREDKAEVKIEDLPF